MVILLFRSSGNGNITEDKTYCITGSSVFFCLEKRMLQVRLVEWLALCQVVDKHTNLCNLIQKHPTFATNENFVLNIVSGNALYFLSPLRRQEGM